MFWGVSKRDLGKTLIKGWKQMEQEHQVTIDDYFTVEYKKFNRQEFKGYADGHEENTETICIQEMLKTNIRFFIKGFHSLKMNQQEGSGGGRVIFIKQEVQHQIIEKGKELEYVVVKIRGKEGKCKRIIYYNPYKNR